MATLEDGTIFTQSTHGIDTECGKIYIRPTVLESMNSYAKTFCISTIKPIIALIETTPDDQVKSFISSSSNDTNVYTKPFNDRIIFKN